SSTSPPYAGWWRRPGSAAPRRSRSSPATIGGNAWATRCSPPASSVSGSCAEPQKPVRCEGGRRGLSRRLEPRAAEHPLSLQHRIGDRGEKRVDLFQVPDRVEMDRARL